LQKFRSKKYRSRAESLSHHHFNRMRRDAERHRQAADDLAIHLCLYALSESARLRSTQERASTSTKNRFGFQRAKVSRPEYHAASPTRFFNAGRTQSTIAASIPMPAISRK